MSEYAIQLGIQAAIQAMSEFTDADVVINDWSFLDKSSANAPYVLIEDSDDFDSEQNTQEPETVWNIPINLIEAFSDWDTTLNNFRTRRQAILDKINSDTVRTAGGLEATNVRRVRNDGKIYHIYDKNISDEELRQASPSFIGQRIILETEEF
ncbi:MAG: hypothetical protein C4575_12930 [Desulforudis sp.]|jgi:hypothetical protein|nr:MAG: hypothetical protein C4575_12930 [Desulforudis sp.]